MKIRYYTKTIILMMLLLSCSRTDERKVYYEDGKLHEIIEYKKNKIHGKRTTYNKDGSSAISFWKEGIRHGKTVIFYDKNAINSISNYKDGNLYGTQKIFYESGNLAEVRNYRDNKLVGRQYVFYDNKDNSLYQIKDYVIYNDNDSLCSYRIFDHDGDVLEETLGVNFISTDSVFSYRSDSKLTLSIFGKNFKNTSIITGDFDNNFHLRKSKDLDTLNVLGDTIVVKIKTQIKGLNYFKGLVDNYELLNQQGDTTETIHSFVYFEFPYHVK